MFLNLLKNKRTLFFILLITFAVLFFNLKMYNLLPLLVAFLLPFFFYKLAGRTVALRATVGMWFGMFVVYLVTTYGLGMSTGWGFKYDFFSTKVYSFPASAPALAVVQWLPAALGILAAAAGIFHGQGDFGGLLTAVSRHAPGLVRGKKALEGGWASWADLADVAEGGPPRERPWGGGIVLGRLQGRILRIMPEKPKVKMAGHVLVIGATGTGKSFTYVRNNIIAAVCARESIVVTDPKGELCADMAEWLRGKGYKVIIFNVMNPEHSHRWNMIAECRDEDEMADLADTMISCAGDDHAFFSGGEKNVLTAVMGYARWVLPEGQKHIRAALSVLAWPEEALQEAFARAYRSGQVPQVVYEAYAASQGHWSNYVEGVRNKLRTITKGPLAALTSESEFSLSSVGRERTALFCVLPTDGDFRMLLTPFYTFLFKRLKELALSSPGGRLPVPVRFILDEFANVGRIPDLEKITAVARSMGVQVQIILQNVGQLQGLYAKEKRWQAVAGNCPVRVCLGCDDLDTANWFVRSFGSVLVEHETWRKDTSTLKDRLLGRPKTALTQKKEHLMEGWELLQLPADDMVAHVRGKRPAYLQKLPWTELPQAREVKAAGQKPVHELVPARDMSVSVPPVPAGETEAPPRPRGGGRREPRQGDEIDIESLFGNGGGE